MTITNADLEAIAAGRVIDSTQAPQIARELIAARKCVKACSHIHGFCVDGVVSWSLVTKEEMQEVAEITFRALKAYDAAREAE